MRFAGHARGSEDSCRNLAAAVEYGRDCQIIGITDGHPGGLAIPTVKPCGSLTVIGFEVGAILAALYASGGLADDGVVRG